MGGDFSRWGRYDKIFGWWGEDSPPSPSRANPDLHSSLGFFLFQGNLYTMFVILDINFCVANSVLASVCSCSQKSWILFTLSTCRAVLQYSESYMNSNDFAVYCHKFFCLCAWQVRLYLMLSKLNPRFNFHKEDLVSSRIIR